MAGQILQPEEPELTTHRCRGGQRCAARTPDGSAVTFNPDTLCHACVQRLQDQLDQLPIIRDALQIYKGGIGGSSAQTKVASSSEAQAPLSVHVLDLADEIDDVLDRTDGLSVDALIRQPAMQFKLWRGGGWRMDYLDGVQRALEIGIVWRKADDVIGMTRPWQSRLAKCPHCNTRTLGSLADTVQCSICGHCMTRQEYEQSCVVVSQLKRDPFEEEHDDVLDLPTAADAESENL